MSRFGRTSFLVMGLLGWFVVAIVGLLLFPGRAAQQVTVVEPGDISTPTPTVSAPFHAILPTPTPTPQPDSARLAAQYVDGGERYTIQAGDTLWLVALEVGVDLDEIPCLISPQFRPEQPLVVGEQLTFMPVGWRCHTVAQGETLAETAVLYGVSAHQIVNVPWNQAGLRSLVGGSSGEPVTGVQIDAFVPETGTNLRIPVEVAARWQPPSLLAPAGPRVQGSPATDPFLGYLLAQPLSVAPVTAYAIGGPRASLAGPVPKDWPYGSGNFAWPVYGWLSQGYREDHRAIDIAAPIGSFVTAADRGVVIRAGWNDQGYGLFVVIDHNIDYVTLYSHLNDVFVREGEVVGQGQVIGTVGSTGRSTGPHLHFEIRDFGRRTNPIGLLVR